MAVGYQPLRWLRRPSLWPLRAQTHRNDICPTSLSLVTCYNTILVLKKSSQKSDFPGITWPQRFLKTSLPDDFYKSILIYLIIEVYPLQPFWLPLTWSPLISFLSQVLPWHPSLLWHPLGSPCRRHRRSRWRPASLSSLPSVRRERWRPWLLWSVVSLDCIRGWCHRDVRPEK